ncbi:PIN domain-containing protein [Solwaraspora sp. WMMD937]|uniref:PIN domain-containing protein n=1 Tax=Solwaraspora sp. WMMD937 TaxID=3016090 RepID=UPI00249A7F07|nr:PIN domain-containing protein [Solwaraspora sp. WMMD937]WFE19719.1 PIN domain-containing protein [Solwaraspora sp. WMMD937]
MFAALLDTCVLWPSLQRDFLLSLAIEGLYRPVWNTVILDELAYEERAKLINRGADASTATRRANRLVAQMRRHFDDAEVNGWEGLDGTYGLPDPDDEHLVAAAAVSGAGAIVTHNLRDLPAGKMPYGLQVLPPTEFAANTVALGPARAWAALATIAGRSGRTGQPRTEAQILDLLESRYGMKEAVDLMLDASADG